MVAKAYDVICAGYNMSHTIHGSQGSVVWYGAWIKYLTESIVAIAI